MHSRRRIATLAALVTLSACSSKAPPAPTATMSAPDAAAADIAGPDTAPSTTAPAPAPDAVAPDADGIAASSSDAAAEEVAAAPLAPLLKGTAEEPCDPSATLPTPIDAWSLPADPAGFTLFPDAKSALVVVTETGYARVDLASGAMLWHVPHSGATEHVSIAPSGAYVWLATLDGLARIDAKTGAIDWRVEQTATLSLVAVTDDTVVYDDDGGIVLEVGARPRARRVADGDTPSSLGALVLAKGGRVVAFDGTTVRWIDVKRAAVTTTLKLPEDSPFDGTAMLTPDGGSLATVVNDKLTIAALPGLAKKLELPLPEALSGATLVSVAKDGKRALIATGMTESDTLHRVDLAKKVFDARGPAAGQAFALASGDQIWVAGPKRPFAAYDASGALAVPVVGHPVALLATAERLVVVREHAVAALSAAAPWTYRAPADRTISEARASDDGGRIVLALADAAGKTEAVALDAKTGATVAEVPPPSATTPPAPAPSSNPALPWQVVAAGRTHLAAASLSELAVWTRDDAGAWGTPRRWSWLPGADALRFSPDDALLALESTSGIAVVDLAAGRVVVALDRPTGAYAWGWSSDGKSLLVDTGVVESWAIDPKARPARPAWIQPWFAPMTFTGSLAGSQKRLDVESGKVSTTKLASAGKCELDDTGMLMCDGFTAGDYEPRIPTGPVSETRTTFRIGELELPRALHDEHRITLSTYERDVVVSKLWAFEVAGGRVCVSVREAVTHEASDTLCIAATGEYLSWRQAEGCAAVTSDFTITFKPPSRK